MQRASLDGLRAFFARLMAGAAQSPDPRLERIFELVPRELFMPPGPWKIMVNGRYFETPDADLAFLYQNTLVALDAAKGINNGEPFLHARWIGIAAPQPGEVVVHIGAGTGYYSAILSLLVLPGGHVEAFEIEEALAEAARANLTPFDNVTVHPGNAVSLPLPEADLIYVNAGVAAPAVSWLKALKPGGRLIFPWQAADKLHLAALITREAGGFAFKPLHPAGFIPCVGRSAQDCVPVTAPDGRSVWESRSVHITAEHRPDDAATAIYTDLWFSSDPPEQAAG
jgi:protein-L-isoaspartate(D-aspartate) O-methyltransferase